MLGAIVGDVIGSAYEWDRVKNYDFELFVPETHFTDDTVLTVALADHFVTGSDYAEVLRNYSRRYWKSGFGPRFLFWALADEDTPSPESWGNGSAMRVSPVAYVHETVEAVMEEARASAMPTHGHPEALRAAGAVAVAVFLARKGKTKEAIQSFITGRYGYDLTCKLSDIRPDYQFSMEAVKSVPEAIIAFLESENFEDAIRKAVSLGGDADTQAAIAGSIAEPFYGGVPKVLWDRVTGYLPEDLLAMTRQFRDRFPVPPVREENL